jgi:NADH dehydrogenase
MANAHVVICGGGAGGIELATRLARRRGIELTLVDATDAHLWKPLLHELASGSIDAASHEVDYLALARWHGFMFSYGPLEGIDREKREVLIGQVCDGEEILIPPRRLEYDLLVIAVGGVTSDFGVPGVREHAYVLDSVGDASAIHRQLLRACLQSNYAADEGGSSELDVAIVGGGATGVELAAELRAAARILRYYGLTHLDPDRFIKLTVINADPRLLLQLPEALSEEVEKALTALDVQTLNGEFVTKVDADGLQTRSGRKIHADLIIWAAGVRGPAFLKNIGGLETNRLDQLVVTPTLQTTRDPRILAMGDCAACRWEGHGGLVPPRAQAASQQAHYLAKTIPKLLAGKPVPPFHYRDFGSLVSLGSMGGIGSLMGFIRARSIAVEGFLARLFYEWLYKRHRASLFGWWAVTLETLGGWLGGVTRPRIKLH